MKTNNRNCSKSKARKRATENPKQILTNCGATCDKSCQRAAEKGGKKCYKPNLER